MIPHVIVLEPGLVIYKIYNGYWFFGRPTLEDLRQDLRAVTRKCRPRKLTIRCLRDIDFQFLTSEPRGPGRGYTARSMDKSSLGNR